MTFEKIPLGALQVELVAAPLLVPANVMVPPAHTPCAGPAYTKAAWPTVTIVLVVTGQL